jgi:superfamily II DNA or RNA helicase
VTTATTDRALQERLEFHRKGIGLLHLGGQGGSAAYVSRNSDDTTALRTCSCRHGRADKKTCAHLRELQGAVDRCHEQWAGRSWGDVLQTTAWHRLAELLFEASRAPCARLSCSAAGTAVTLQDADGHALLRCRTLTPATVRLLDRCGVAPGIAPATSRARLLDQLLLFQLTDHERALYDRGLPTHRQAFEGSFWHRLAYHCIREYGSSGTFHPTVDEATTEFLLEFRPPEDAPLHIVLPRTAVGSALRALDLPVRPIPLVSIFKISATTEMDLDVRPQVRLMQADGHARYLEREEVERFRYGNLVWVRELGVLAELERPGRERKFVAPARMLLAASQVPRLLETLAATGTTAPVLVDTTGREVRILEAHDAIEVTAHESTPQGFWSSVDYRFGDASVSAAEILRARAAGLPFLQTPGGWIDVGAPAFEPLAALTAARHADAVNGDRVLLSPRELLRLRAFSLGPMRMTRPGGAAALMEKLLALQPATEVGAPRGLTSALRPYQRIGHEWLVFLHDNGLSGLLCDEMGLGKTHQVLALLLTLAERGGNRPFLVVCPTSVVCHWRDKIRAHAPGLALRIYHDHERELPSPDGASVVLTSYGILRNDVDKLRAVPFAVAVFDEVQQLKNSGTLGYQAAERIDARMRLGMTGTPLENDVGELKALVDLVLPGYLGTEKQFVDRFGAPSSRATEPRHTALQRALSPFLLRRRKTAVLDDLPEKTEDIRLCGLSPEQASLYRDALTAKAGPLLETLRRGESKVSYLHVFALLDILKRICDHPALALRRPEEYRAHASGKWDLFEEILNESLAGGEKVIVFTQYLGMIEMLERAMTDRGVGAATLTGSTRDRAGAVARFNSRDDCRVFLASLKAAGHGIDLVSGSVVIHYDRWWNAAREDQATDRAHRIGQRRAVQVFKLVTEGTLEQRIATMIDDKRRLMESVIRTDEPTLAKTFTREELIALLSPLLE